MADIELVIKLDKDYYDLLKNGVYCGDDYLPIKIITNGTPLPKGHGRLIDADELKGCRHMIDTMYCEYDEVVNVEDIDDAPTIIEADTEKE